MTDTTWTPYADLRLLHGARARVSPEHMAAVFGTTVDGISERLHQLCGGQPDQASLTAAIAERGMPRPERHAMVRENRTPSREVDRDLCAAEREAGASDVLRAAIAEGTDIVATEEEIGIGVTRLVAVAPMAGPAIADTCDSIADDLLDDDPEEAEAHAPVLH